jgi:hypothetical protein
MDAPSSQAPGHPQRLVRERAVPRGLPPEFQRGVNVEELESSMDSAPMSGEALFVARARLLVPAALDLPTLRTALEGLGGELMVDLTAESE